MKILKDCGILEIWNVFYIVIILTCYGGDKWERKGSSWTVIILCQADKGSIVLVSLCHVESLEEGTSIKKKKSSHHTVLWANLWFVFLINDWQGRAKVTMASATPGRLIVLSVLRKAEHTTRSKPVSSVPSTALHQHPLPSEFLWGRTVGWSVSKLKPFLSQRLSVLVFYHSNRNPKTIFKGNS